MMNFTTMQISTSEFDRAMVEYAAASGKDFKDIVNRQLLNLSIQGGKLTRKAERSAIRQLENTDMPRWPKIVASIMSKKGHYTVKEAKKFSKKIIRRRSKSIGFLKFFFRKMGMVAKSLAVTGSGGFRGKSFEGFISSVVPATKRRPTTEINVTYFYKKRNSQTARRAERELKMILPLALRMTALDMRRYINKKMGITARKYSAR